MRFQTSIKCVTLMISLASCIQVPELPAGAWSIEERSDGSLISRSVDDPTLTPIITRAPIDPESDSEADSTAVDAPTSLNPRFAWANGDCWSYKLNAEGTDRAVTQMKEWYSVGRPNLCSNDSNGGVRVYSLGGPYKAMVYYCIVARNACGNLDLNDVNYALRQMDAHCPRYQASWFRWPGSNEIVGKANVGDHICVY
ncbi:hypothetical protein DL98DRAFT_608025 [Cadophora sp. DSE1049]|nr:hypothetical protein DL98DRAFT_608025 [Cadophora sp. DSE1049]